MTSYNAPRRKSRRVRDDWYYYDRLPPQARAIMADAAFNWDSKWIYDAVRRGLSFDLIRQTVRASDDHKAQDGTMPKTGLAPIYTQRSY